MSVASDAKMVVKAAVLCLLFISAASAVEADTESSTVGVNVTSSALSSSTESPSTYSTTTMPEIISCVFSTTQVTTTSVTPTHYSTTPPTTSKRGPTMDTALPTTRTTFITTTPLTTTITMFTSTTSPTTSLTTTRPPSHITMLTTNTPVTTRSSTTLLTSSSTTMLPPTTTFTTTTTTRTTSNPEPAQCHNGGFFDGIKCVCPGDFYGTFCELISDTILIGTSMEAEVNVEIIFTNREFTENLTDATSEEFKRFELVFKSKMNALYSDIPGYKDVIIQEIRRGSIIVSHKVIVKIAYKSDQNIAHQYNQTLLILKSLLKGLESNNCTSAADNLCVGQNSFVVEPIRPPSEEELCMDWVPEGYETFYDPVFFHDQLACVSHCDPYSPKYLRCNDGTCWIKGKSSPQCFCARTDLYIYTSSQCTGKISKLGLFIGGGITIGILLIVSIVLGICIYIVKRSNEL